MKRKGQSSLEFVLLVTFVILIMTSFMVVLQRNLVEAQADKDEALVGQVMNLVTNEILFAEKSDSGFKRTFYVPTNINGEAYTLRVNSNLDGSQDIVFKYRDRTYVYFMQSNATQLTNSERLSVGTNTIEKLCGAFTCQLILQ